VHEISRETGDEIKQEIAKVAESVFNIVSENVEEKHVSDNMRDVGVKEHGCKEGV